MPPRHHTLPPPQTSAAREAQKSFYCELCAKGYSRMNDYEAHLSSYDHSHKQRLKDMKAMVRDSSAGARARKADEKAGGLLSIKLPDGGAGTAGTAGAGFKKSGFKKSGFKSTMAPVQGAATEPATTAAPLNSHPNPPSAKLPMANTDESDTDDEGYQVYDPRYPTD